MHPFLSLQYECFLLLPHLRHMSQQANKILNPVCYDTQTCCLSHSDSHVRHFYIEMLHHSWSGHFHKIISNNLCSLFVKYFLTCVTRWSYFLPAWRGGVIELVLVHDLLLQLLFLSPQLIQLVSDWWRHDRWSSKTDKSENACNPNINTANFFWPSHKQTHWRNIKLIVDQFRQHVCGPL